MAKKNSLKRAIVFGATSMALSVSMFVGTTFAWFTDSVTSSNNRIVAGTLKVDLLMDKAEDGNYTSIANGEGDIFSEATGNGINWEPGKTEVVYLAVENKGSLDLKYKISLNITDNGLAEALEYAIADGAKAEDFALVGNWKAIEALDGIQIGDVKSGETTAAPNGKLYAKENGNSIDYFALAVHMKEEKGNEYQGKDVEIDVQVSATQLASEEDSFGPDYDDGAQFEGEAGSDWELISALSENKNVKLTSDIDLSGVEWSPIATYSGVLDGNGFAIKNLKGENGLFDNLSGATVKNLKLENVDIDATSNHTGALAGYVVKSAGVQTVIDNVTVSGVINGGSYYVGGIVGADSNYDTVIKNCVNNATVTAPGQQVGGIVGYTTRGTLVENCVNNGEVTGGSFVGGIIGMAAGDDEMPELSITVKSCANNGAVAETNTAPSVTWQGGVGGIIGNVGRAAGDKAVKPLNFYISADCTVLDGQKIYGQKHNVAEGDDALLNVWILEEASNDTELAAALDNLKNLDNTVFYGTMFELAEGTYAEDYNITVAALGNAKGDLYFKAADGAEVVFTGTTTLGYRNQGVAATEYSADTVFENIRFDHAEKEKHSLQVEDIESLNLVNCTIIGDGEYGICSARGNGTGNSKIVGCTFKNAGIQVLGNFGTGLVIDNCKFIESCVNMQSGNGVTIQNCEFTATLTDAHNEESFYLVRSSNAGVPITVKNCKVTVDSTVTGVGVAGSKGWGVFVNRVDKEITVSDVEVTFTEAALAQSALQVATCLSTGKIICTNVTLNGEALQ